VLTSFISIPILLSSDHAWGGNYFVAGGEVEGKKILGKYPDDLSADGPLIIPPSAVIPTTPWEAVWNGIAQWFGATTSKDLNEILPNRNTFADNLFSQGDIYEGDFTDPPTTSLTPAPTAAPTLSPVVSPTKSPTMSPIKDPTKNPTQVPTKSPTKAPTKKPIKPKKSN